MLTGAQITLEDLSLELKSAGNFTPEVEKAIITTLQSKGLTELSFLDYLVCRPRRSRALTLAQSYMPMFLHVHGNIISNPLEMQHAE